MNEGGKLAVTPGSASSSGKTQPKAGAWRAILAAAVRDPAELLRLLDLPNALLPAARAAAARFPLLVPRGFIARMQRGDVRDPLLCQVLPLDDETRDVPGFTPDPLGERSCELAPGLLRKYRSRALLVATGACAVHCRYCFRRDFAYADLPRGPRWWEPALTALRADATIEELILSGGDPLTLPDAQLAELVAALATIPHVLRLRIHSRLPIVIPERLDDECLAWLTATRLHAVLVVHANHPQEIDADVQAACRRVVRAGIPVLNQSVLLAGINADAAILAELSRRLSAAGVIPYYLHALDPVRGTAHFAVPDAEAIAIHRALAAELSGYLVPRLVREVPGKTEKTALFS